MIRYKPKAFGLIAFITALMLCVMSVTVLAAEAGTIELKANGSEALLIMDFPQAAAEEIASMQLSLSISMTGASSSSGADIEFAFDSGLSSKIVEARYHSDTGFLNIYLSGTEALFQKDSPLTVGKVILSGNNASASVSVVRSSIKFVRGGELISPSDVRYPQAVKISADGEASVPSDSVPSSSSSSSAPDSAPPSDSSSSSSNSAPPSGSGSSSSDSAPSSGGGSSVSGSTPSSSGSSSPSTGSVPEQSAPESGVPNGTGNVGPVDKSSLLSALSIAESYKRSDYTESSYNALVKVMNKAQSVLSDNNATQNDIDSVLLELENSIAMLVPKNGAPPESDSSDSSDNGNNSKDNSKGSDSLSSTESSENVSGGNNALIWVIIAVMAALIGAIVTIIIVLKRRNVK
ncbi:MAG: hypothetical protein J1F28_06900 [Oscillospiraceae bacterium]|nr:hypothetical protein [Oscillospiraceae bacterium]